MTLVDTPLFLCGDDVMGLISGIIDIVTSNGGKRTNKRSSKAISGKNPSKNWLFANKFNRARGGFAGGYGAWTFGNIMNAHGSPDMIVDEFGLELDGCPYEHPHYGCCCYQAVFKEKMEEIIAELIVMAITGGEFGGVDIEDAMEMIDPEEIEEEAYDLALELAEMYINGDCWIPTEIINWAYYDVSDHNKAVLTDWG